MDYSKKTGSALLTVLLIITIIFILSSVLISTALNSAKQNQLSEKQIQATNLAEMGVIYFNEYAVSQIAKAESYVKEYHDEYPTTNGEQLTQQFCTVFQLTDINNIPITSDPAFSAKVTNVSVDKTNCNQISVQFVAQGIYKDYTKKINGTFQIKNNSITTGGGVGTTFPKIPADFTSKCSSLENCDSQSDVLLSGNTSIENKNTISINGLYIDGSLDMSGTHSNLIIGNGNLYVNGTLEIANQSVINVQSGNAYFKEITGASNAEILINGDAYLYGDVKKFKTSSGNQLFVNITGTIYVSDESDLPANYPSYCDRSGSRGICASDYKHISEAPATNPDLAMPETTEVNWDLDEPSFEIQYQ